MSTPAEIINRCLDAIGRPDLTIGELDEGTEAAKPALRAYGPAMRQLLRVANWGFARKMAPMTLLGDATGQTANVGTIVTPPWTYVYEQPGDLIKARFVPWNSQPQSPTNPPIMTGLGNPPLNAVRLIPAPFLIALDYNYPIVVGAPPTWDATPQWWNVAGGGPTQRTVILTNVKCAWMVYTALVIYPSQWDALFEEAMVQFLASKLALPLAKDPKFGLAVRAQTIASAKEAITQARLTSANESGFPQSVDHVPDFIRTRSSGAGGYWGSAYGNISGYAGPGVLGYGWDQCGFSDGSVF